jgi:hypothetical protein
MWGSWAGGWRWLIHVSMELWIEEGEFGERGYVRGERVCQGEVQLGVKADSYNSDLLSLRSGMFRFE